MPAMKTVSKERAASSVKDARGTFSVTKGDYEKVRKSISEWPKWKREVCNVSRPTYAKQF